jgi:hypothetical protein
MADGRDENGMGEEDQHRHAHGDVDDRADQPIDHHRTEGAGVKAPSERVSVDAETLAKHQDQHRHQRGADQPAQGNDRQRIAAVAQGQLRRCRADREGYRRCEDQQNANGLLVVPEPGGDETHRAGVLCAIGDGASVRLYG